MAFQSNNNTGAFPTGQQQNTGFGQGPTDKLANAVPGHHTGAPGQLPGSNNPTGHSQGLAHNTGHAHESGLGGAGASGLGGSSATHHGSNTHASNTLGSHTAGSHNNNYDSNNTLASATHGTHQHGVNQGPTDKLANAIPGHNTGAPGALPGSNNPSAKDQHHTSTNHHTGTGVGATHGSHNTTHGSSNYDSNSPLTSATHGTHEHGLNQGPADRAANVAPGHHTGAPGAVPGSHNPSSAHHQTGAAGLGSTTGAGSHTATGSHHDASRTHDSATKPSMADKIGGKVDVLIGKATHNEEKIVQGEIKQTEGKAGLEHNAATGAGRI